MYLKKFNLQPHQTELFDKYYNFLISENKKYNITAITDKTNVYIKHFHDSLIGAFATGFTNIVTYCDIGSGGGFPAIPLKVLYPHLELTLIEPTGKKAKFLEMLCEELKLNDVNVICSRAEDYVKEYREYYDVVSARAVAPLPILLELAIPFLKIGGSFLAYKGSGYREEIEASKRALKLLDSAVIEIYPYTLPLNAGERVIINIEKTKETKTIYPRKYGQIKKKHL